MNLNPLPTFTTTDTTISIAEPGVYVVGTAGGSAQITLPTRVMPYYSVPRISPLDNVYRIVLKAGAKPATIQKQPGTIDQFSLGGAAVDSFDLMPGEAVTIVDDGALWVPTFETTTTRYARVTTSSAQTLTLNRSSTLWENTCTGNSTWTLPVVSDNKGLEYVVKNTGPATMTLQGAGGDLIHDGGGTVGSVILEPGTSRRVICGASYWLTTGSDNPAAPRARARVGVTGPTIANNTVQTIALTDEDYDTAGLHSTTTNNSRITLNRAGAWLVVGQVGFAANATGRRFTAINQNGAEIARGSLNVTNAATAVVQATAIVNVTGITDYVELAAFQDSGAPLGTLGTGYVSLSVAYLGS